jgi:hypothetical protein
MDKEFGLKSMLCTYLGIGSNVVQPWVREERKSIGAERFVCLYTILAHACLPDIAQNLQFAWGQKQDPPETRGSSRRARKRHGTGRMGRQDRHSEIQTEHIRRYGELQTIKSVRYSLSFTFSLYAGKIVRPMDYDQGRPI